jgi:hypothetical protein
MPYYSIKILKIKSLLNTNYYGIISYMYGILLYTIHNIIQYNKQNSIQYMIYNAINVDSNKKYNMNIHCIIIQTKT